VNALHDKNNVDRLNLSKALVPMVWVAAQFHQPKASRVAAARWASKLLTELDLTSACHLLCFLSGDADPTASSIAKEGLGFSETQSGNVSTFTTTEGIRYPDFNDMAAVLFSRNESSSATRLQTYWDFSHQGQAASIRFGLVCLHDDIYGGEDQALELYLYAICNTLSLFLKGSHGRSSVDLLDDCSYCILSVVSTCEYARRKILQASNYCLSIRDLERLSLCAISSRARRHLAGVCGKLYEDETVWDAAIFDQWIVDSGIDETLHLCAEKLALIETSSFPLGEMHGSAFLGSHIVRAVRLNCRPLAHNTCARTLATWDSITNVLIHLGRGTLSSDEIVGSACADGLAIALSYEGFDAPILDSKLFRPAASLLINVAQAVRKYSNGDSTDPLRAMKIAKAAGVCLASTSSGSGVVESTENGETIRLGPARLECVEALFEGLGSMAFRKEEEVALVIGEGLAAYADSFSPKTAVWSSSETIWPMEYNEAFAQALPPHQHVLYVLLTKTAKASSPHIRTSSSPALLAVVARAAKGVNTHPDYVERAIVKEIHKRLDILQQTFLQLLAEPKSRHLSRESACIGLAGCRGLLGKRTSCDGSELSEEFNRRLLSAFGQTTKFEGSAMMETNEQAELRRASERTNTAVPSLLEPFGSGETDEVGGVSGMGESALGAYREMASASVALGRYDVLYALLFLSVSHPCWFSDSNRHCYRYERP
jgi:proteasome component ECM29